MRTENLRTNQLSDDAYSWYAEYLKARTEASSWRALNHYTRQDGEPVTLRAVAFTDRDAEGLFSDTAPLFA